MIPLEKIQAVATIGNGNSHVIRAVRQGMR